MLYLRFSTCHIVPDCKNHLSEPDLKLVWPSAKLLQAACSASNRASYIITAAVMPSLLEQYNSKTQVKTDQLFSTDMKCDNCCCLYILCLHWQYFWSLNESEYWCVWWPFSCAVLPQTHFIGGGAEIHPVSKTLPVFREWQVLITVVSVQSINAHVTLLR